MLASSKEKGFSLTRKIKWGILGTKWISSTMAEAIQQSDTGELIAIASRDLNRAIEFSKKHNVKYFYNNYYDMLANPDIDAVYIGLPNHLHKEWIIRCAEAGKHILCEKPFVLDMNEANEAFAAVKKYKVFCMEALMYQCHPLIAYLEKLIHSKEIGDIQHITAIYNVNIAAEENSNSGSAIRSLGCYPASLVRLLMRDEPIFIIGNGKLNAQSGNDNVSVALLHFKNDITATLSTSNTMDWWWQFTVFGSKGTLHIETNPWLPTNANTLRLKIGNQIKTLEFTAEKPLYSYQIDSVGEHILNKIPHPIREKQGVTWKHTLGNVSLLENWLNQVRRNKNSLAIQCNSLTRSGSGLTFRLI